MIPKSIRKVLSSIQTNHVQALLMGGQACVLYGAAEFSRDADFAILASPENFSNLQKALQDLQAKVIALPPWNPIYLEKGHAIHFRCFHPEAFEMRVDVMSKMRGVDPFPELWKRRTEVAVEGENFNVMSLPDLVKAKKTQRDKDWPMIRRLVEANYFQNKNSPNPQQIDFWLRELRTAELLVFVCNAFRTEAALLRRERSLLGKAIESELTAINDELAGEETHERQLDREYWAPLMAELRELRRHNRKTSEKSQDDADV